MTHLKLIKQQNPTECGVACVAMISGTSLTKARAAIQFNSNNDYRTDSSDLRQFLSNAGLRLGRKVVCSSWDGLSKRAIVAIAAVRHRITPTGLEHWHWVVFDGTSGEPRLLDPLRGIRTDFGRLQLSWYNLVTKN